MWYSKSHSISCRGATSQLTKWMHVHYQVKNTHCPKSSEGSTKRRLSSGFFSELKHHPGNKSLMQRFPLLAAVTKRLGDLLWEKEEGMRSSGDDAWRGMVSVHHMEAWIRAAGVNGNFSKRFSVDKCQAVCFSGRVSGPKSAMNKAYIIYVNGNFSM